MPRAFLQLTPPQTGRGNDRSSPTEESEQRARNLRRRHVGMPFRIGTSVRSRRTKRLPKQGGKKKRLFNCQKVCALPCLRKVPLVRVWSCPKFAAQCRQKAQRMVIHGNVWVTGRCVRLVRRLIVQMKRDDQEKATNRVPCRRNDPAAGKFSTVSVFCLLQSPC